MNTPTFSAQLFATKRSVYGVILNDHESLAQMAALLPEVPYKGPPKAPAMYLKTANTFAGNRQSIRLPDGAEHVEVGATLGIVMGASAAGLRAAHALESVAGFVLVADLSLPHHSYYRPAIREKCFDASCVLGDRFIPRDELTEFSALTIETHVNGKQIAQRTMGDLLRDIPTLLQDVTEFMTLRAGDVLLVGVKWQAPTAGAGDVVQVLASDFDPLEFNVAVDANQTKQRPLASGRRARVFGRIFHNGAIHEVEPVGETLQAEGGLIRLADGRILNESEAHWLPPVEPGAIFALGLNYADHARELAFKAPEQPLVFLKGPAALSGHRSQTRRPADATFMHHECELAVVIGKPARHVTRAEAYQYVAGYTVANDYAIRDYLENYYRPNMRVKNRDACTPVGPWLVEADAVADPMNLSLRTTVNGKEVQRGNTSDMVFDIPDLIAYLSSIMTLSPGDIILTGTPEGLANVVPGDYVVTEIEQVGRLVNTIVSDEQYFGTHSR